MIWVIIALFVAWLILGLLVAQIVGIVTEHNDGNGCD